MTGTPDRERATAVPRPAAALRQRLAELRGTDTAPRPLDARALAALAANPGCRRRALLDGAGVDKSQLAVALGTPAAFGQSQFAFARGHAFERRVRGSGGTELARLLHQRTPHAGAPEPDPESVAVPELTADGPLGRVARTRLALREANERPGWTVLHHPLVELEVAGSPAYLEPDAVVVEPDGGWTVVEIKSFPILDGAADPGKVGAAARQAAVYALALERAAGPEQGPHAGWNAGRVRPEVLLVCPKDFSNLPTAELVDVRKQLATTRRQLGRLTRIEEIAAALPPGTSFDPASSADQLTAAVESVPAAYAPDCLAACELAFHCRSRARAEGAVAALGRSVRGELGALTTVGAVLAAAYPDREVPAEPDAVAGADAVIGPDACRSAARVAEPVLPASPAADPPADPAGPDTVTNPAADPAGLALRRAARLRAEALGGMALCGSGSAR